MTIGRGRKEGILRIVGDQVFKRARDGGILDHPGSRHVGLTGENEDLHRTGAGLIGEIRRSEDEQVGEKGGGATEKGDHVVEGLDLHGPPDATGGPCQ